MTVPQITASRHRRRTRRRPNSAARATGDRPPQPRNSFLGNPFPRPPPDMAARPAGVPRTRSSAPSA